MTHGNAISLSSRICRQRHHCPQQPRPCMRNTGMGANHPAGSRRQCTQRLLARCSPGNSNKDDTSFSSGTSAPSGVEETSPAPDAGLDDETLQLPKDVIEKLRYKVFSFDTFYVTAVENYEADGVLFKGNLRGDPRKAVATMRRRLQEEVDAAFELFLLNDKEDKPVCVVLPARAVEEVEGSGLFEGLAAAVFLAATAVTTFGSAGVPLMSLVLGADPQEVLSPAAFKAAAPGAVSLFALLLVHEAGHRWEAGKQGVKLSAPFFIPAGLGLLGSFGAITRIKSVLPDRESLLRIAAAGPAAGTAAALVAVVVGTGLSVAGLGTVEVEASAFQDSLLMGALGKLVYGPQLEIGNSVVLHPLMIAGWAALVINALNCIPAGELDGGRIAFGLWGRRAAGRINAFATVILGVAGIFDTVALYWVLILLFLQRGPVVPQREEISTPDDGNLTALSAALLFLPLLMLLPFPAPITIYP